ncbi:MAG: HDOD domain-containing protein [Deltaproteobacteria bacterium]|nr:HDOD domain-containing protein [Deltaproteobacteria bacterium]
MGFFRSKTDRALLQIRQKLDGYEIPTFPSTTMTVLSLLRSSQSTVKDITTSIEMDPGLHVKVLRTVNSAAFGLGKKVSNLDHAIKLLGRARLESTVLSTVVSGALPEFETSCFDHRKFWLYSSRRAALSRILASKIHPETQPESFTAAFLMDIAVSIMAHIKKDKYCNLWKQAQSAGEIGGVVDLENKLLSFNHCQLGGILGDMWELPPYLIKNILFHHSVDWKNNVEPSVRIVSHIFNEDEVDTARVLQLNIQPIFNLSEPDLKDIITEAFESAREFHSFIS